MNSILLSATVQEVFKYIGFVLVALIALMIMIVLHELGHYTAGRLLGFKIDEFAIGMGPKLFKRVIKKTGVLFSIRLLPIGGFCAFHGEDAEGNMHDENGNVIKDENGNPVKDPTAFNSQKAWKRLIVLFSGAFMNFISAILIITIYFAVYGQILPGIIGTHERVGVEQLFEVGDVIINVNGKQVNIVDQSDVDNLFASIDDSATFKVLRNGKVVKLNASKGYYNPFIDGDYVYSVNGEELDTPIRYQDYLSGCESTKQLTLLLVRYDDAGEIVESSYAVVQKGICEEDGDGFYSYGFGITRTLTRQKLPFYLAFGRSFGFCFYIVFKILASLGALITGKIGIEAAGGTITTIKTMAEVSSLGFDSFLYVVAIISANLAVMNLMPFPALDGSRMLFTLIEMIFKKPIPRKIEGIIHTVGLVLLLVLAVFLDVFHLVKA